MWLHNKAAEFAVLRRRRGLPPLNTIRDIYTAELVFLADPPHLVDGLGPLPPGHVVTGPCSCKDGALPDELQPLRNLLLLSMGSTGKGTVDGDFTAHIAAWAGSTETVYAGTAKVAADTKVAWIGRAANVSEMPSSSREWAPNGMHVVAHVST